MRKPEILAPAGSMESLRAAVYCGANAVYLGGKEFNARRNATNFTLSELKEAVAFCHERSAKVYETLNILMFPNETDKLLSSVEEACSVGIDGVMVQDLGALSIIKKAAPKLPCFASTQMAVHNLEGAQKAFEMGCSRVVLARELTKEEIAFIAKNSPIPVEVFVHGAHCMCLSGQCYLSSMIGGRSGNRGLCAQPCRLPFKIGDEKSALSLKDLCLVKRVKELCDIGVSSLKIEGRMKRPEYVAAAVTAVKAALNGEEPNLEDLQKVFSRSGFTDGYFMGKRDVSMFGTRQKEDVVAARDVLKSLSHLATKEQQHVPLFGEFEATFDKAMNLSVSDNNANTITAVGNVAEKAHTRATDEEHIIASLNKTGGTPFFFDDIAVDIDEGLMVKASELNGLRREALERLSEKRRVVKPIPFENKVPTVSKFESSGEKQKIRVRCDKNQLSQELIMLSDEILIPFDQFEFALQMGVKAEKLIIEIPRVLFGNQDTVCSWLLKAKKHRITKAWAGNVGALHMAKESGMTVCGGWSLNIANDFAANVLKEEKILESEISPELTIIQAEGINSVKKGIISYGYLPLMTFRNCPVKARIGCEKCKGLSFLTDRMGIKFPVSCKSRTPELLNSVPIYLADRIDELASFSFLTLWFNFETKEEVLSILKQYKGKSTAIPPKAGHTRGLYYRGVK